jgi:hypothetical protein
MLDADIAGHVCTWLESRSLDPARQANLRRLGENTISVLPQLDRPAENIYVRGLQELARLVLQDQPHRV